MPYYMNAKGRSKLKRKLRDCCIVLCNRLREDNILILRGVRNKINKRGKKVGVQEIWDLPTCACYCYANDIIAEGYSHRMYRCNHILAGRLLLFGNIGQVASKGALAHNHALWPLGQCAEQHAANRLLYEANARPMSKGRGRKIGTTFSDICVGPAYRVKTRQFMQSCINCKEIFSTATIL